tara:strand:+ start:2336 stop:2512 length:177 start_codon:yes stop_codon:yes gene_type:complete
MSDSSISEFDRNKPRVTRKKITDLIDELETVREYRTVVDVSYLIEKIKSIKSSFLDGE